MENMTLAIGGLIDGGSLFFFFSTFPILFSIVLIPIAFLITLGILKLYEPKDEDYKPDPLLHMKAGMYFLQIFMVHLLVMGVFQFIDIILSQMTDEKIPFGNIKLPIGVLVGSGSMLLLLELLLVKFGVKENYHPRRLMYGIAIFLFGFFGTVATFLFLSGLFEFFPKGAAFHVPLAAMLVYLPVFVVGVIYYKHEFAEEKEAQTFLPASFVQKADQMMAQMPGASLAGFGAAPSAGFGAQPMAQPMMAQPMAQPMAQQFSQPMAQPQAAPAAAPGTCSTCGQPARFITQYNRYWCDTCQKYL